MQQCGRSERLLASVLQSAAYMSHTLNLTNLVGYFDRLSSLTALR